MTIPAASDLYALTDLAALICQTPISIISFIDDKREFFKFKKGFDTIELPRETSFAQFTINEDNIYEVPDMLESEDFKNHPLVTIELQIRFYAGIPLVTPEGHAIGTLAVMDIVTRSLGPEQRTGLIKAQEQHTADVYEWTYITKSGKKIPVWVSLTSIRDNDENILGFLAVAQDYTARKKIESDLLSAKDRISL